MIPTVSVIACAFGVASACLRPGVVMSLDRASVSVGQEVRLVESIPTSSPIEVAATGHDAVRVKWYDPAMRRMVSPDRAPVSLVLREYKMWFPGLIDIGATSGSLLLETRRPGRKGLEFRFTPTEPGVFRLTARWLAPDAKTWIDAEPVVLTVWPKPQPPKP